MKENTIKDSNKDRGCLSVRIKDGSMMAFGKLAK